MQKYKINDMATLDDGCHILVFSQSNSNKSSTGFLTIYRINNPVSSNACYWAPPPDWLAIEISITTTVVCYFLYHHGARKGYQPVGEGYAY